MKSIIVLYFSSLSLFAPDQHNHFNLSFQYSDRNNIDYWDARNINPSQALALKNAADYNKGNSIMIHANLCDTKVESICFESNKKSLAINKTDLCACI